MLLNGLLGKMITPKEFEKIVAKREKARDKERKRLIKKLLSDINKNLKLGMRSTSFHSAPYGADADLELALRDLGWFVGIEDKEKSYFGGYNFTVWVNTKPSKLCS